MPFIEAPTTFYLGRRYDQTQQRLADEVIYYDSRDLTTHAIVVGMTGSGKTGMCIAMLEEAALDGVPAIVIDPKGDISNLLLNFPQLRAEDFRPWINISDAQRAGLEPDEFAQEVAQQWREGLAQWGISTGRMTVAKNAVQYSIYTPGSEAGLPVSILASLQAPRDGWEGHEEFHREQISGIVTALMALIGKQVEPVKDREHVLISNIFEEAWRTGQDLTLEDIILQVQNPPFARLGVFDVNTFFPEKDRFKLAKELNHIIAAPSFQTWMNGVPLDMRQLLYTPEGRPRVSIFYLAHLSENERSFMITLILENMLSWMRTLSGTTSLRAILYFDEVFGHVPPAPKNPPTKEPILRLLKTARAFGIGLVLATQNPGDLDYKGLSNAGTWLIGKLQTENDKKRVLGGLESAASAENALDVRAMDSLISGLAPRVFVLHNVHDEGGPVLVHSRWAMSYLRGPLTRQQVRILMEPQRAQLGLAASAQLPPQPAPAAVSAAPTPAAPPPTPTPSSAAPTVPPQPRQTAQVPPPSPTPTPPPDVLPGEKRTEPPPNLPGERSAAASPFVTSRSEGRPTFLDRLRQDAVPTSPPTTEPESAPSGDESYQPSRPFSFVTSQGNMGATANPPASAPSDSAFWLEPSNTPLPIPQPPIPPDADDYPIPSQPNLGAEPYTPYEGQTIPVGSSAPQPAQPPSARTGTGTVRGVALPEGYSERPPILPTGIAQYFLPILINMQQAIKRWETQHNFAGSFFGGAKLLYRPVLFAQMGVRYIDRKSGAEADQHWAFHVSNVSSAGFIRWSQHQAPPVDVDDLSPEPYGEASYGDLSPGLTDPKRMRALRDEVLDFVSRTASLILFYNPTLDLFSYPSETQAEFVARASHLAREKRDAEIDAITAKFDKQVEELEAKLQRAVRQAQSDREVLDELKREDLYTTGEAVLSLLKGRTSYTLSRMSRARRYKKQAQEQLTGGQAAIVEIEDAIEAKQRELEAELGNINEKWKKIAQTVEEYKIKPYKKDIALEAFGIGWVPLWYVMLNNQPLLLLAFDGTLAGAGRLPDA